MKAYYPYAKTVYQGEKYMTIQFMLWWFSLFKENDQGCSETQTEGEK